MGPVQSQIVFFGVCFFGATFGAIVLTLVGIFFLACGKYTNCTGTKFDQMDDIFGAWLVFAGWWLMGLIVVIMFLLSGVLLPISMLLSDACAVVSDFPTDMHAYLDKIMVPPQDSNSEVTSTTPAPEGRRFLLGRAPVELEQVDNVKWGQQMHSLHQGQAERMPSWVIQDRSSKFSSSTASFIRGKVQHQQSPAHITDRFRSLEAIMYSDDAKPQTGPSPTDLLIGCYNRQSLLNTLNMTSEFEFADSLNFSSLLTFDADSIFNFTDFELIRDAVKSRTPAAPDWVNNSRSVNGGMCDRSRAMTSLSWMNSDLTRTRGYLDSTKSAATNMHASLSLAEQDLAPLIKKVET